MRKGNRVTITASLLLCAVTLLPVIICGKSVGTSVENMLCKTVKAANANSKLTATQWLGTILTNTEGDDREVEIGVSAWIENKDISPNQQISVSSKPKVLIYHTHTNEAYEQSIPAYSQSGEWRTDDTNFNIVRIGQVLTEELTEMNFQIVHDTTNHVPPKLSTAYSRSLQTMLKHKETGNIEYYIDVHRDAYFPNVDGATTLNVDGVETAKIALVVGKAEGEMYAQKPEFDKTYRLAKSVEDELNRLAPGICKPVIVRVERFNQHVSPNCMLVEIGHNKNTVYEAEAAACLLAKALNNVMK